MQLPLAILGLAYIGPRVTLRAPKYRADISGGSLITFELSIVHPALLVDNRYTLQSNG